MSDNIIQVNKDLIHTELKNHAPSTFLFNVRKKIRPPTPRLGANFAEGVPSAFEFRWVSLFRLAEILDIAKIGGQKNNVVLRYIPMLDKQESINPFFEKK